MRVAFKITAFFFLSLGILGGWTHPAVAYVLQGPHILDLMTDALGPVKKVSVSQKIVMQKSDPQQGSVELTETVQFMAPESFYSVIRSQDVQRIQVVSKGEAVTVIDDKIAPHPETRFDLYKYILFLRSRPLLMNKLASVGVDVQVSSIGRFQNKIAFVIGAQYPDESLTQLWVEKETFIPLRWIVSGGYSDRSIDHLEIRYSDWRRVDALWYPMIVEFFQNETLVRKIHVEAIQTDASFSAVLFDIDPIRTRYRAAEPAAKEDRDAREVGEIRKTIDDFEQIFK